MAGRKGLPADAETRSGVLALVERVGERRAGKILKLSNFAIARIVAGFGVQNGTVALARINLPPPMEDDPRH